MCHESVSYSHMKGIRFVCPKTPQLLLKKRVARSPDHLIGVYATPIAALPKQAPLLIAASQAVMLPSENLSGPWHLPLKEMCDR